MIKNTLLPLLFALSAVTVIACGGDDDDAAAASPAAGIAGSTGNYHNLGGAAGSAGTAGTAGTGGSGGSGGSGATAGSGGSGGSGATGGSGGSGGLANGCNELTLDSTPSFAATECVDGALPAGDGNPTPTDGTYKLTKVSVYKTGGNCGTIAAFAETFVLASSVINGVIMSDGAGAAAEGYTFTAQFKADGSMSMLAAGTCGSLPNFTAYRVGTSTLDFFDKDAKQMWSYTKQ